MKWLDVVQGSPDWAQARLGVATASQFGRILTEKKLVLSAAAGGYVNELIAEWATGEPCYGASRSAMDRGTGMEAEAVADYELRYDVDTKPGGFCLTDDGMVGCSPDRLVGDDGGLEVKCPLAATQVGYLLDTRPPEGQTEYRLQVQGSLWITGRKWWDRYYYGGPVIPSVCVRFERDEEVIARIEQAVHMFRLSLEAARERFREMGGMGSIERARAQIAAREAELARQTEAMFEGV